MSQKSTSDSDASKSTKSCKAAKNRFKPEWDLDKVCDEIKKSNYGINTYYNHKLIHESFCHINIDNTEKWKHIWHHTYFPFVVLVIYVILIFLFQMLADYVPHFLNLQNLNLLMILLSSIMLTTSRVNKQKKMIHTYLNSKMVELLSGYICTNQVTYNFYNCAYKNNNLRLLHNLNKLLFLQLQKKSKLYRLRKWMITFVIIVISFISFAYFFDVKEQVDEVSHGDVNFIISAMILLVQAYATIKHYFAGEERLYSTCDLFLSAIQDIEARYQKEGYTPLVELAIILLNQKTMKFLDAGTLLTPDELCLEQFKFTDQDLAKWESYKQTITLYQSSQTQVVEGFDYEALGSIGQGNDGNEK